MLNAVLFEPLVAAASSPPYPPSQVIPQLTWAPPQTIRREARGSDNWPLTWGDDDALYGAYGDGQGFVPMVPKKLSMGFARITGGPMTSPERISVRRPARPLVTARRERKRAGC